MEAKRVKLNPQKVSDLFFYIVLAAIIGSRVFYVFVSVPFWWKDPLVFIRFWEGGLVFYGGLIGAVLMSVWYTRQHKLPFFKVADIFIPGVALGHVFGRLGCFAAGCCYGKETSVHSLFSVVFPFNADSVAPPNVILYNTQMMEAVAEFLIFLFLILVVRFKKKFDGEVFLVYIMLYPILRSILEIFRGDKVRGFVVEGIFSTAQFVSVLWVLSAIVLWVHLRRRKVVK
jgi:phosphatidylglycerol:prolipoprotein diacylglycerol transferase